MPSTAGLVAAQAVGGGAMMMALPPFSAIIALLTGVADGLVDGVMAPTTPTGLAYLTMPFSGISSMMPVDLTLSRSRSVPKVFLWFLMTLLSTSPMPVTSTAISARRRAFSRLVDRPGERGDGLVDAGLTMGGNLACVNRHGQARIDEAVTALAWSIYKPENARRLAEIAVEVTGIGEVESKVIKNQRKTFGTLRDLLRAKSTGIIEEIPEKGLVLYAKPVGVVGAITPSTNPSATPVNKAMMALKGGNAIIIAPPPSAWAATKPTVDGMRAALEKIGLPADLVQILPSPVTREATTQLMEAVDLVVVTGSQVNVRQAYKSGKPALGVGLGNAPVIIDDIGRPRRGRRPDHAVEDLRPRHVVLVRERRGRSSMPSTTQAIAALERQGGYMASAAEKTRIVERLWQDGKLNRAVIAQGPQALIDVFELSPQAQGLQVRDGAEETGIGKAASAVGREAVAGAHRLSRQGLRRRQAHRARHPRLPGQGPLLRHPHQERRPRARARRGHRRGARAGQPGAHLRQRRRLQQWSAVHAVDGLRHLAGATPSPRT